MSCRRWVPHRRRVESLVWLQPQSLAEATSAPTARQAAVRKAPAGRPAPRSRLTGVARTLGCLLLRLAAQALRAVRLVLLRRPCHLSQATPLLLLCTRGGLGRQKERSGLMEKAPRQPGPGGRAPSRRSRSCADISAAPPASSAGSPPTPPRPATHPSTGRGGTRGAGTAAPPSHAPQPPCAPPPPPAAAASPPQSRYGRERGEGRGAECMVG